jgi:hypothetical protein
MPTTGSRMGMVAMLLEVAMAMEEVAMPTMEDTAMSPLTPKTTVSFQSNTDRKIADLFFLL